MKRFFPFVVFCTLGFVAPVHPALADPPPMALAGAWLTLPDVQLRLLQDAAKSSLFRGGVEIRLAPGFKTYWKNPGDSGVSPRFDFSRSSGLSGIQVLYPLPTAFDDRAGGTLIGYEREVTFPVLGIATQSAAPHLHLKLEFAICGTLCVPHEVELSLDPVSAIKVDGVVLEAAFRAVPDIAPGDKIPQDITLTRLANGQKRLWQIDVPFSGSTTDFSAFPEAASFVAVERLTPQEGGKMRIILTGEAMYGGAGRFNPARLTFGTKGHARDIPLDLDGAARLP